MKNIPLDKILEELEKTTILLRQFRDSGNVPEIERDIALSKLRNIYESLRFVQSTDTNTAKAEGEPKQKEIKIPETPEVPPKIDPKPEIPKAPEINPKPEVPITPKKIPEIEVPKEEILEIEPESLTIQAEVLQINEVKLNPEKKEPDIIITQEKSTAVSSTTTTVKTEKSIKKEIFAEKFQSHSFLNEVIARYHNTSDLSKKLQSKPISDISTAISMNEKFLYIKELFNNDASLYKSTIEKINYAGNFNDAIRYLAEKFTWDFNDPQVQKLLELVRRRYSHEN